jgi:hypothetical protein
MNAAIVAHLVTRHEDAVDALDHVEKRGDTAQRLRYLRRASQFRDTRYGAEACKALGDDA